MRTPYDTTTNTFPREFNGQFADNDIYIDCANKVQICSYGHGILELYCPSIGRGRNIIKAIRETFQEEIILDYKETDFEVIFKFHAKHLEKLVPIVKPKTSGADISPFSSKNLPKNKTYKIPDEDLISYKELVSKLPQNQLIALVHVTKDFIKSLATKKYTYDEIKADMALKCLKGKEYIHSIGKWKEYINYLKENLKE